ARGLELSERQGDAPQLFTAIYGLWQSANGSSRVRAGRGLSDRLLLLTADGTDEGLRLRAHHSAWSTALFGGEPAVARDYSEAGRRLYDPERHPSHRMLYGGHDPGACADFMGAQAYWLLGYPEKALTRALESLSLAERIAHPLTLEAALLW